MLHTQMIHETLSRYFEMFPEDKAGLSLLREQCEAGEDIGSRKNFRGHVTGSGLVLHEGKILLIFHKFLQKYLQPGGHYEGDASVMECAMREVKEEMGLLVDLHLWHEQNAYIPFHIDTHTIPENKKKEEMAHFHHDHLYVFTLKGRQGITLQKEEVDNYLWKSVEELAREENIGLRACAQKILKLRLV